MSFNSFNFEASPATPFNKSGFPAFSVHPLLISLRTQPLTLLQDTCANLIPSHSRGSKRRKEDELLDDVLPSLNQAEPPSKKCKTV